jgi:ABC-2 type transport system ATP-binding protein
LLLSQYGLSLDKRVEQLSHGMQTKLALTLALAHEPELLILDEPTTGLDPIVREEFLHGILDTLVADMECTVVLSSHIMSDIETVCDTIAIINEGKLLLSASRQELIEQTKRLVVTLDEPTTDVPIIKGTVLVQRHADHVTFTIHGATRQHVDCLRAQPGVHSVDVHDMSLEDVFKDVVKGRRATP